MGYVTHTIEIRLELDHHGGEEQDRDQRLMDEIRQRIGDMLDEPQYEHLDGWTSTS